MRNSRSDTLLVTEWIESHGGAEAVFARIESLYPSAEKLCAWRDAGAVAGHGAKETWLARSRLRQHKRLALPLMVPTWRYLDTSAYDRVIIATHAFAHQAGYRRSAGQTFIYVHTPARYVWETDLDERSSRSSANRMAATILRAHDRRHVARSAHFATNSQFVAARAERCWGVDARVIYPPVAVEELQSVADWRSQLSDADLLVCDALPDEFILGASRWVEYKQLPTVIQVASALGMPAVIAGGGPDEARLMAAAEAAPVPVHFVHSPNDAMLRALMQQAEVFVFPPIEDFGIIPVEAMALGTPVLVNAEGGARESSELIGGGFAVSDFADVEMVRESFRASTTISRSALKQASRRFSRSAFDQAFTDWVDNGG